MIDRQRIPSTGIGIALGLLLASRALAGPAAPPEATFVGDARADIADDAAAKAKAKETADFRRWGANTVADEAPSVFLPERPAGKINIRNADPTEARKALDDYLITLDKFPAGSPQAKEAARIRARLALIPAKQKSFPGDLHPIQFLEYLRTLPDNKQELVLPPKNTIKIVDQVAIKKLKDAGKPMPQPVYRTTTVKIVTHHLVPTFKDVYTEYPV